LFPQLQGISTVIPLLPETIWILSTIYYYRFWIISVIVNISIILFVKTNHRRVLNVRKGHRPVVLHMTNLATSMTSSVLAAVGTKLRDDWSSMWQDLLRRQHLIAGFFFKFQFTPS
jgi:hypothetical protein